MKGLSEGVLGETEGYRFRKKRSSPSRTLMIMKIKALRLLSSQNVNLTDSIKTCTDLLEIAAFHIVVKHGPADTLKL